MGADQVDAGQARRGARSQPPEPTAGTAGRGGLTAQFVHIRRRLYPQPDFVQVFPEFWIFTNC